MRTIVWSLTLVAALLAPSLASAQASVEFRVNLPVVLPQLVVVSPGVQVVPDVEEEVFFTDGYYWVRRDERWYRSRTHRSGWVFVEPRYVPARLGKIPPGQYKHWHKEQRKEAKEQWKAEKREMKAERKEGKGRGKGHGKHGD
jgi:hypothetical protein